MKICWDTLEGFKLIKSKYFRKGSNTYIYIESCEVCGEAFLTEKTRPSNTCSGSCKLKGRKHSKKSRRAMSDARKGVLNHNYKGGVKISMLVVYDTYNKRLGIVEDTRRSDSDTQLLEVKCAVCGEWFLPDIHQAIRRINDIEGRASGVGAFYCSDVCKLKCSNYRKRIWPNGHNPRKNRNSLFFLEHELKIWSNEVLKRAAYICEYCGKKAEHAHHIEPKKLEPGIALDPDNGLACCIKCHYKYGHKDECSTSKLSSEVCN